MAELLLGVNIDHIATLRNARGTAYPDPVGLHSLLSRQVLMASPSIYAKIAVTLPTAMSAFCVRRWTRV